jgi:hypothetical protein
MPKSYFPEQSSNFEPSIRWFRCMHSDEEKKIEEFVVLAGPSAVNFSKLYFLVAILPILTTRILAM